MTVEQLVSLLKTKEIKVTLLDADETELVKFYSEGYDGISPTLLAETVEKWFIASATSIIVYVDTTT